MGTRQRIPIGPLIGIAGALLLLVSLFLNWWEDVTAFTGFEVLDLLLAGLALAALVALADAAGARLPSSLAPGAGVALPLGLLALVIVLSQIVNDPPAIVASGRDRDIGIWLALAGTLLMLAGSLLSVARISLALDVERRERGLAGSEFDSEAPTVREPGTGAPPEPPPSAFERSDPERPI